MSLWTRIFGVRSAPPAQEDAPLGNYPQASAITYTLTDEKLEEFLRGGKLSASGVRVGPQIAQRLGVANRCTSLISGAIGTMAFDIKRKVGGKRVDVIDHPASILLRKRPNHWQTPAEFRKYMQRSVLNRGNGYAYKVKSRGRITALYPLAADQVVAEQNDDMSIQYRYQRKHGGEIVFPQSDIFHLRGPSEDTVTGISVISYAAESMGLADSMRGHASRIFKSATAVGGIFSHPKKMGDPEQKRFKTGVEEFRGNLSSKSYADMILEEGMTYARVGMSSVDAQLLQIMEATDYGMCMFYGVPPHMAGLTTKQTSWGSGVEQQSIGFVAYTLLDHMTLWQQSIERDLCDPREIEDGLYAKFNPASLIQGDIKTRYAAYATGRQWGWESANSVLALEDRDDIGEQGDIYLIPGNMLDASNPPDPSPAITKTAKKDDSGDESPLEPA